jgi:hypothetical protein
MASWRRSILLALGVAFSGCESAPPAPPPASAPSPNDACRAIGDSLATAVPLGQSLAELQARGIRLRTPLVLPPGAAPRVGASGGAAVQMLIQPDGSVAPGSTKTLKSVGEPQVAAAIEAGALSMSFDVDAAARPAAPVPFTMTFAVCNRS